MHTFLEANAQRSGLRSLFTNVSAPVMLLLHSAGHSATSQSATTKAAAYKICQELTGHQAEGPAGQKGVNPQGQGEQTEQV